MEQRSSSNWAASQDAPRAAVPYSFSSAQPSADPHAATASAAYTRVEEMHDAPPSHVSGIAASFITTGAAMDAVAAQCERRGLTSAATWLSEMSLHAIPAVLAAPVPPSSSLALVAQEVDRDMAPLSLLYSAPGEFASTSTRQHFQRLHRVALGYFLKGEYQRCHQVILREVMHTAGIGMSTQEPQSEAAAADSGARLPAPEVVRGFRTTPLPPLLQFLSLYALFMDGIKAKQLSNNANSATGAGPQRAVHPHARVLRAYLLEAMRNPVNHLLQAPAGATSHDMDGDATSRDATAPPLPLAAAAPAAAAEGWDPHTPSAKKQPWTITSASRGPGAPATTTATTTGGHANLNTSAAVADGGSSVGSHTFSNFSPATNARHPMSGGSPAAATPMREDATLAAEKGSGADLLHVDPYLTWLMGVVLRELRMRQECATFLLASVTVNPLLRCAWEDLTSLVSREVQLTEIDAALDGVEPFFMTDIFAAEVRGLLGVNPVSSARLRTAAAAAAASSSSSSSSLDRGGPSHSATEAGAASPLSPASAHALNGATTTVGRSSTAAETLSGGRNAGGGGAEGAKSPTPPPSSSHTQTNTQAMPPLSPSSPSAAASSTNAWECLLLLFPDTPSLMGQLAHFFYHQRNRLDRAEALYRRIRSLDPHYYGILYDYSNVLYTKRDRLGLSSLVQSVYQADAFRAETNFAVGNYYVLLGQHDRAALHFHRTTAIDPQCAEAWLLLGHAYVEVKNTTAAVEAYRTAVELNERDYRGWYNLGQIYELLEAYHHALYYYWHTTSLRPADPGMWVAVANCLEHDGRVAESIACLERAESYDVNTSPNYPAYVRRIATHHIANSSFTRACVYLEKLAQSPAATGEDMLLALPFLIQHYVQRARKSVEVSARSSSYDPALFSPGLNISPSSSPSSASAAGRTALNHARAAAALQHLRKAEDHLEMMAELVLPAGTTISSSQQGGVGNGSDRGGGLSVMEGGVGEEALPVAGVENVADDLTGSGRRRGKTSAPSYRATTNTASAAGASVGESPPVAFVRSRHYEITVLRSQVMQLLHPAAPQPQPQLGGSMPASAGTSSQQQQQQQQRGMFSAHPLGRH